MFLQSLGDFAKVRYQQIPAVNRAPCQRLPPRRDSADRMGHVVLPAHGQVNEIYAEVFGDHKPARSCVEVRSPRRAITVSSC